MSVRSRETKARGFFRRRAPRAWAVAFCVSLVLIIIGCKTPNRYEVLSFFFDGVPDPNATTQTATGSGIRRGNQGQIIYIHKPLLTGECNQCHKNEFTAQVSKAAVPAEICRECHTNLGAEMRVIHGPVAANQCVICHQPHRSSEQHLLRVSGSALCFQCHMPFDLSNRVAEHQDAKIDCMSCHHAHGGETHALLKAKPATAPATQASGEKVVLQQ